jgi:hypothetical protein
MRHVPLVVAAFETLSEAERALHSLLDAGFPSESIRAAAQAGGGRLLLADRVAVQAVGEAAQLADGDERAASAAFAAAVAALAVGGAAAFALRLRGLDPMAAWRGDFSPAWAAIGFLAILAALAAVVAGLSQRPRGLPHDLALRYARRLERGDVVLGVRSMSGQQARSVHETFAVCGASDAHITRGVLESLADAEVPPDGPSLN